MRRKSEINKLAPMLRNQNKDYIKTQISKKKNKSKNKLKNRGKDQ